MIFKRSTLAREIFEEVSFEQVKMINLTIEILKRNGVGKILDKQRIDYTKKDIDLLKIIVNFIFWIKENECPNFRTREETERLIFEIYLSKILNKKIIFFALFCPSYKKGVDLCGFNREIGETTKRGIENLDRLSLKADSLGIKNRCLAVYSDLVLENCDKLKKSDFVDLNKNFNKFKEYVKKVNPKMKYLKLSKLKECRNRLSYKGICCGNQLLSEKEIERITRRSRPFYEQILGWKKEEIENRTRILALNCAIMGEEIARDNELLLMVMTEKIYERAIFYSANLPYKIPIFYPIKKIQSVK